MNRNTVRHHAPLSNVLREYVSPKEAAEITGLAAFTWRRYARERKVGSTTVGGKVRIPISEIRRFMAEGYRPALNKVKA